MINYPLAFDAESKSVADPQTSWKVSAGNFEGSCAIPTEFGGPGKAPSPEDFFLLAIVNCFVATFKVYANASKVKFENIQAKAKLVVDKSTPNQAIAKSCLIRVSVEGAENPNRIQTILKKVSSSGILLNSVKTELQFSFHVNGEVLI